MTAAISRIARSDWQVWRELWRAYLSFYGTKVTQEVEETTFARLLSNAPGEFAGRLAVWDGQAVGLVHYLFHRHCWHEADVVYLQDLYVSPQARGKGIGRRLIEAVYAKADAAGAASVYWLTQDHNATARRLYDRVADVTPFIKYQRPARQPGAQ